MANPRAFENGKATRFRSGKEAAKKGTEGGKASGEARAAFKSLKEDLKARCTPERVEKMNNTLLLMAERGNLRAYEIIQRSLGEDPEIEIKRAELKLKKAEAERKRQESQGTEVQGGADPRAAILEQIERIMSSGKNTAG